MIAENWGQTMDERDFQLAGAEYNPSFWEYNTAQAGASFDKNIVVRSLEASTDADVVKSSLSHMNFGDLANEDESIRQEVFQAWKGEGLGSPLRRNTEEGRRRIEELAGKKVFYGSVEDFSKSEYYRPGVDWYEGMTVEAGKLYAENFDQRRKRETIIQAGDKNGMAWQASGFLFGMAGSLPDPINFIPFGGGLSLTKTAGVGLGKTMARGAASGAVEGAIGNAISSSLAAIDLNTKGENIGFRDVVMDTIMGAGLGGGMGGLGGVFGRSLQRRGLKNQMSGMLEWLPEDSAVHAEYAAGLDKMKKGDTPSFAAADEFFNSPGLPEMREILRQNISNPDKMELARAFELALEQMRNGEPVNVGAVLRETDVLGRAWDIVAREVDAKTPAGKPDEVLTLVSPEGLEPLAIQRGPMAVVDGEVVATGKEVRALTGSKSGYGLTKVQIKHADVTRADVMAIPRILRQYEPIADSKHGAGRTWVVERPDGRKLVIGEAKTPDGGVMATVHLIDKGIKKTLSKEIPSQIPSKPFSRSGMDTNGGVPDLSTPVVARGKKRQGKVPSDNIKILREGEEVNTVGDIFNKDSDKIDWSTANPEEVKPFHEAHGKELSPVEEAGIDPATGISHEEMELTAMLEAGQLNENDTIDVLRIADEQQKASAEIDKLEEAALSIVPCIMGVAE